MRRRPPFTKKELEVFARDFIDHFGELHELAKIRVEIEALRMTLEDRLTFLAVALGGGSSAR